MIKRMWDFYLSPNMGWIIYASFLAFLFPEGAAQATAMVVWMLCVQMTMIRSLLFLFVKEKRKVPHWWQGFWIGVFEWIGFLLLWILFGKDVWRLWIYPFIVWRNLEGMMFVR